MRKRIGLRSQSRRIAEVLRWTLREPSYWRISLILFLVIVFSLVSTVSLVGGAFTAPPEETVENVLRNSGSAPLVAYPFLFALVSLLATLAIVVPRVAGGFAALQALGYRRGEILVAQSLSMLAFAIVPTFAAFLILPPFVEPNLILSGNVAPLYPPRYWVAMPRSLLAIVFLTLFAAAFGMVIRRVALAFAAMITFFFVGWNLGGSLGFPYGVLAPSRAFGAAYGYLSPIPGIPFDPNYTFLLYLAGAVVAFLLSLAYVSRRGELQ